MNAPEQAAGRIPQAEENRHEFLVTSFAEGFALAALPVAAQTIDTDRDGLASLLRIKTEGRK